MRHLTTLLLATLLLSACAPEEAEVDTDTDAPTVRYTPDGPWMLVAEAPCESFGMIDLGGDPAEPVAYRVYARVYGRYVHDYQDILTDAGTAPLGDIIPETDSSCWEGSGVTHTVYSLWVI